MKRLFMLSLLALTAASCSDSGPTNETGNPDNVGSGAPAGKPAYIRRNANSPSAGPDLAAYAKGLAAMKALPCSDNRSWYYWGAMHHIPDLSQMGGTDSLCTAYGKTLGPADTWSNCPHMLPGVQQLHFLAWHRLYTWYFERIVRKFSGKKDFALPYWDYNAPAQRMMPRQFVAPAGYNTNPLWEGGRSRWLMAGYPIKSNDSDAVVANVNGIVTPISTDPMGIILDTSNLWNCKSFALFSAETEQMPHNCMHDYIGGAVNAMDTKAPIYNRIYQQLSLSLQGLMANVPSAGFDPIFFLHHANIDRLWMNWELDFPEEALRYDEFNQAGMWTYNFIDENGKEVRYTSLKQVFDSIRSINYTYDYLADRKPKMLAAAQKPGWDTGTVMAMQLPARKLSKTAGEQVSLDFPRKLMGAQANAAPSDVFYKLEVEVSVAKPTHSYVAVLVDVKDNVPMSADPKKHIVGIAGLFGLQAHEGHGGMQGMDGMKDMNGHGNMGGQFGKSAHGGAADGRLHKTFVYDINEELALQNGFNGGGGLNVYLSPLRPDPANPVTLEKVTVREVRRKAQ